MVTFKSLLHKHSDNAVDVKPFSDRFRIGFVTMVSCFFSLVLASCSTNGEADSQGVCERSVALNGMYPTDYPNDWLDFFAANDPDDSSLARLQLIAISEISRYQSSPTVEQSSATLGAVADWNNRCVEILNGQ